MSRPRRVADDHVGLAPVAFYRQAVVQQTEEYFEAPGHGGHHRGRGVNVTRHVQIACQRGQKGPKIKGSMPRKKPYIVAGRPP